MLNKITLMSLSEEVLLENLPSDVHACKQRCPHSISLPTLALFNLSMHLSRYLATGCYKKVYIYFVNSNCSS